MNSKTKIVVLHVRELIYTGIFAILGILFLILLIIMFLPGNKEKKTGLSASAAAYTPGIYTTSLILNDHAVDIEVTVDEASIHDIRMVSLDEAVAAMYPLIEPAFEELATQIRSNQSLDGITYSSENKYTSLVLLDAIRTSLDKARITSTDNLPVAETADQPAEE